jgi:hypothetical protein
MIQRDDADIDEDFLTSRQQFVFKGAVLLICAALLAMVFLSGKHGAETNNVNSHPSAKGAPAPLEAGSTQPVGH